MGGGEVTSPFSPKQTKRGNQDAKLCSKEIYAYVCYIFNTENMVKMDLFLREGGRSGVIGIYLSSRHLSERY